MNRWKIIFVTFLIPVLILVFLGVYIVSKGWEIYCKIISQMQPTHFRSDEDRISKNRGFVPSFTSLEEINKDLAQMYHYHDNLWHCRIPKTPIKRFHLKDNGTSVPPNAIAFEPDDKRLFLIFRSTKTNFEISQNLRICQKKIRNFGYVHRGISRMYGELRNSIIPFLEDNYNKYEEIIIFGHSLGGAFVNVLSVDLQFHFPEIWGKIRAYSSGSPKILDPKTVKIFEKMDVSNKLIQIVNAADIVSNSPLCSTVECSKNYYYKSFSKNTINFNRVIKGRPMDSHVSRVYSNSLWESKESINLKINVN